MGVEVPQHVKDRLEPQMLDMALAVTVQRQAEVLRAQIRTVSSGVPGWLPAWQVQGCWMTRHQSTEAMWYCVMLGVLTLSPL